jgi:hypothetical protein
MSITKGDALAISMYSSQKVNSSTVWILFILFGWSYGSLDKIGLQILYYLTFGGFGFWFFFRLFTLGSSIKEHNRLVGMRCGLSQTDMAIMGLY